MPSDEVPCPTSAHSAPCATTARRSPIRRLSSRRRTTSSGRPSTSACLPAIRPTSCGSTCPATSPVTNPTRATDGPPGRSPAGDRTARSTRTRIRRSTSTSRRTGCRGPTSTRTQRGFFARLRLEPFGPGVGRAPARADDGRAAGGSLQAAPGDRRQHQPDRRPVRRRRSASADRILDALTARRPDLDVDRRRRSRGIGCGPCRPTAMAPRPWRRSWPPPPAGPLTIADGHHRYETALRYRDERRMSRSCEEDPAFDYVLTLFLDAAGQPLTVLPTHRIVRGLGDDGAPRCSRRLDELFDVERGRARGVAASSGSGRPAWPTVAPAGSGSGRATAARS